MPTYVYDCEKCKKSFEIAQSMKDAALTTCPKEACRQKTWGKGRVKRQIGAGAGLIFKGSGFYITDYRSEGYKAAASAAKSESSGGESKGGDSAKKAESKPSAPAADKPKSSAKKKKD